ncbi:MAG: PilZ domain-containing protein [Myxococcota bacterium]|nr:PilZ domain-containing protein [Myxococcota bacterium]
MSSPILLVDDGELEDVRLLLAELGLPFTHLRGGAIPDECERPEKLFVASPRRSALAAEWPQDADGPSLVCISAEDSNALRDQLRTRGFHFLVRRPIHSYALRLVLIRALYGGSEKREEERVVVGQEVEVRAGTRAGRMLLVDLSTRGCRLVGDQPLTEGSRVTVLIPASLACGEPLGLRAKVVRCDPVGRGHHDAALALEDPSESVQERLEGAVAQLRERNQAAEGAAASALPAAGPASDDRRKHRRVAFDGTVHEQGDAERTVLGRDLSMGGMRIGPRADLSVGDTLRLAVYAEPGGEPFEVAAEVVRDDGDGGMALRFTALDPAVAARMEALVGELPGIEALDAGESAGLGAVVSEILEREGGLEDD